MQNHNDEPPFYNLITIGIPTLIICFNVFIFSNTYDWNIVTSLILAQLFIYVIILSCIIQIKLCYIEWKQQRSIRQRKRELRRIGKSLNKCESMHVQDDECSICFDSLKNAIQLPCGHIFHLQCLEQMLDYNHTSCPLCRADMA